MLIESQAGKAMVERLGCALLANHQLTTLPGYGALTPIPSSRRGDYRAAREVWDNAGKPGGEGNADFERAVLDYLNKGDIDELIEAKTLKHSVTDWKWTGTKEEFPRGGYLLARDILYDADYMGVAGGAEINPET